MSLVVHIVFSGSFC